MAPQSLMFFCIALTNHVQRPEVREMGYLDRPKRLFLRESVLLAGGLRRSSLLRHPPLSWGARWSTNRYVPWAARIGFVDGIHEVNGIRMEIPRPPDWGGGGEFHMALGTYEHAELRYILERLLPGDGFLDVGAHIGYVTLPVAKRVGSQGRVIAVEPWSGSAAILRRNISLNGFEHVSVAECAASDQNGDATFIVSSLSPMWNTLREGTLDGDTRQVAVETRTLDSILAAMDWPRLAGIKLDVEGAESNVLLGSTELLARNPQAFLLFEVAGGRQERIDASLESLDFLERSGYSFCRLTSRGTTPVTTNDLLVRLRSSDWQEALTNVVAARS